MATCSYLTLGLDPSCEALKKLGGVNKRVWIGQIDDIASITFGVDGEITALTLAMGKTLKAFIGKKEKHQGTYELTAGETINLFNQSVTLALYFESDLERKAVNELVNVEDMFVFVETNSGVIESYGIANSTSLGYDNFGLKATAGTGNGTGILINDETAYRVTLSGNVPNLPMLYKPASPLASVIADLDAML